jgi:ubiquinone/menaquinone biosynthesis C-methylase UbiE
LFIKEEATSESKRSFQQIEEHYKVEKELASRLRNATRKGRSRLLNSMYDELFERVPHHPRLRRQDDASAQFQVLSRQLSLLQRFLSSETVFLEIGCGDCGLGFRVADQVSRVHGVDVADALVPKRSSPPNFEFAISDGIHIDMPDESIDVAYSNQLMEHLHPEDAIDQLAEIYRVLVPGGVYVCVTPNRVSGPHDISKHFDEVATGFHLKEYTTGEIQSLFREIGFDRFRVAVGPALICLLWPAGPSVRVEKILLHLPHGSRRRLARNPLLRQFIGRRFVGWKSR